MSDPFSAYIIDPQFRNLVPPISMKRTVCTRNESVEPGKDEFVYIWQDHVIDGFEYFEICKEKGITPVFKSVVFARRTDVLIWICKRQIAASGSLESFRKYLIGKLSGYEKCNTETIHIIRKRIAEEYELEPTTVYRYEKYAKTVDRIRECSPKLAEMILDGTIHIPFHEAARICDYSDQDFSALITNLESFKYRTDDGFKEQCFFSGNYGAIKEMPAYDPDAEVNCITLTVPSWIRTVKSCTYSDTLHAVSSNAKNELISELIDLIDTSNILIAKLKGE